MENQSAVGGTIMKSHMKLITVVAFISILIILFGCYSPITGTVVDAETGKPIEGAVVMAEWTKRHGIGDYHTESVKVVEVLSDKDGKVRISGILVPFVDPPDVTVYKKGYVAWSNRSIFMDGGRKDFVWNNGAVFKLEKFKPEYSYVEHDSFVSRSINASLGLEKKQIFMRVYDEGERRERIRERNERMGKGGQQ
jgi:hypothetical protein